MQAVSAALKSLIDDGIDLQAKPKVVVEFNHNVHGEQAIVQNASGWWGRWWERNTTNIQVVENGATTTKPAYQIVDQKLTPVVDQNFDEIDFYNYDPGGYADTYNARFEGTFYPWRTGVHSFYLTTDDGARMWINDELVIDKWIVQGATEYTATVNLTRGEPTRIVIEHFEASGGQRLLLQWTPPGGSVKRKLTWHDVEADRTQEPSIDSDEYFPIEHTIRPRRPRAGLPKVILGQSRWSTATRRTRLASKNARYKYWKSPRQSRTASPYTIANCRPQVTYDRALPTNKIVLHWETWVNHDMGDYIIPTYDLYITADGETWTLIASDVQPDTGHGRNRFFYNGTSWVDGVEDYDNYTNVQGVRAVVKTMNKPSVYAQLIEISARLELDVSEDVETVSINRVREEQDSILPIGHARTSTCSVSFDNTDDKYINDNPSSLFYGLLGKDARVQVWMGYNVNGTFEYVKHGVFYTLDWLSATDSPTASMNGTDWSRFLQEEKVPIAFYRDRPVSYIVEDILEQIGMRNFKLDVDYNAETKIPFVWFNDDSSVWDTLTELARAEQATFYFDEGNTFIWQSRDRIYNDTTSDWQLHHNKNLINVSTDFEVQSNQVTVRYKKLEPNADKSGTVINSILWQPDGNVVLQSAPLAASMTVSQDYADFAASDLSLWPMDAGYFKVEGEIMHYRGRSSTRVNNVRRGLMGTQARPHTVDLDNWANAGFGRVGWYRQLSGGRMKLGMGSGATINSFYQNLQGNEEESWSLYGTKMQFTRPKTLSDGSQEGGGWHTMGGMVINLQADGHSGYYFELVGNSAAAKANIGNVRAFRIMPDGSRRGLPQTTDGLRGYDMNVVTNRFYTLEVWVNKTTSPWTYNFYVNGILFASFQDNTGGTPPSKGLWGPYVRGLTEAEFEYFYCLNPSKNPSIEELRLMDRRNGDYISGYYAMERDPKLAKTWFFDEFGANAHEIREFVVDYSTFPALTSRLLSSNDWEAVSFGPSFGPFSGRFWMENISRESSTLNGEDVSALGESVNMHLLVYGQVLRENEEKKVVEKDVPSIRKYGLVEVELQNPWIQSKAHATKIAEWMITRWGSPTDVVQVECILHPGLQVGDVVDIYYPLKHFNGSTHKYHVLSIDTSFDGQGVNSSLTLRRIR